MSVATQHELGILLRNIAESLDISDTQYKEAIQHYEVIGKFLNEEDSPIAQYGPEIYSQGSFRLGTMIKPITDTEEYDIDLVCELKELRKERVTQKVLKDMVGDRLKEAEGRLFRKLEPGKRCWTLDYAKSTRFHMDILPAIPDHDTGDLARWVGASRASTGILITDKQVREWQRSNPVGYAEWFKEQMQVQLYERRLEMAERLRASVEEVPEYLVKTPLQRAIQILKRHRDRMFRYDPDHKPISIIISTLAAKAYDNETDLLDALLSIVHKMPGLIERDADGNALVTNPVNPYENFADRWQEFPQRKVNFGKWITRVQEDLDGAFRAKDFELMAEGLKSSFGDRVINTAIVKALGSGGAAASVSTPPRSNIVITEPTKPWRP